MESVRYKLRWAQYHHDALKVARDRYFDAAEGKISADATGHAIAVMAPDLPWEIPYIVGDCLQNLRSCLDYLARELCAASGSNTADHTSFPVCKTAECFGNKISKRAMDGISVSARAEIESLQPYITGGDPARSKLWVLHELCNINKHRRVFLSVIQVYEVPPPNPPAGHYDAPIGFSDQVKVDRKLMADIALKEGVVDMRILEFTNDLLGFIQRLVLPRFEKFF